MAVDNAPAREATRDLVFGMDGVRYVREPRPWLGIARNTGILHCDGDLIAFTDDDVVVHPQWIGRFVPIFEDPPV